MSPAGASVRNWLATTVLRVGSWLVRSWWQVAIVVLLLLAYCSYASHLDETKREAAHQASLARIEAARIRDEERDQERKVYVAKRRGECYDIYVKERQRYNNTDAPEYDEETDRCSIRYKRSRPDPACKRIMAIQSDTGAFSKFIWDMKYNCESNTFTNTF